MKTSSPDPSSDTADVGTTDSVESTSFVLSAVDVRRKRPPMLSFLLRLETLRRAGRVVSLLIVDIAGIFAAVYTALMVKMALTTHELDWGGPALDETTRYLPFVALVSALLFARSGLYTERAQRPGLSRIVSSLFQVAVVSLIFAVVNGEEYSSYYIFYGSLFFAILYLGLFRWVYEFVTGLLLRAAGYRRRALVVGVAGQATDVARALESDPQSPIELVGHVTISEAEGDSERLAEITRILNEHRLDEVIIAGPEFPQKDAVELVDQCHRRGIRVRIAPSTMEILVHRAEFVTGSTVPLFELRPPVFEGLDFLLKRIFDCVVSLILLVLLSPLLLISALLVRLSSRGPIFYRSIRPGIGGAPFACFKFRTMRVDADRAQTQLEALNEASGALFKIRNDPRMTSVGSFLRRYSIDELPQLINVLLGEMSLVGPRPLPQRDFDRLEEWHKKRYLVLPGVTGLWQISGRSELDFDDLVRLDFLYLERWSIGLDLTILLKTVPAVLFRRGAF